MAMKTTTEPGIRETLVNRKDGKGKERCFYARLKMDGRTVDAKVGTESEGVTLRRAAKQRVRWQTGADPLPQVVNRRKKAARAKEIRAEKNRMTYGRIWETWCELNGEYSQLVGHRTAWNYRLKKTFANKTPAQVTPVVLLRFKKRLAAMKTIPRGAQMRLDNALKHGTKKEIDAAKLNYKNRQEPLSYATQAHALKFLRRLTNWAIKTQLIKFVKIDWEIANPTARGVDSLTREQIQRLIRYCEKSKSPAAKMVLMALYTGARRTEILNMRWADVDYDLGVIRCGVNLATGTTKDGEVNNMLPLNSYARAVVESIPKVHQTWVFPSPRKDGPYNNPDKALRKIKRDCELPESFRILHGCRHIFATHVGTIGDAFMVKELLHHKDLETSKTYTHVPAEHLKQISERVVNMYHAPTEAADNVVDFEKRRKA